jgi:pyridoxine 4-dehydrogenase
MSDAVNVQVGTSSWGLGGDLPINRLGFGAMRITGPGIWGEPPDHDEAIATLRRAVELGVNLIDTADSYGPHVSERLIAEALHPYPDDLVIATKGGLTRSGPNQWSPDGRPQHLRAACDDSLQRLQLEQIPLYQFHRVDPAVPLEDSLGMLVTLKEEGKIRHIGVCNMNEDQLERALRITPIVSVQNRYGHGDRSSEAILDRCEVESLAFLPWAPLGGGTVTDATVERIATEHGATARQVVLAWLLARSPVMVPIPGTGSVSHLEENIAARALQLTPQEIAELNRI